MCSPLPLTFTFIAVVRIWTHAPSALARPAVQAEIVQVTGRVLTIITDRFRGTQAAVGVSNWDTCSIVTVDTTDM